MKNDIESVRISELKAKEQLRLSVLKEQSLRDSLDVALNKINNHERKENDLVNELTQCQVQLQDVVTLKDRLQRKANELDKENNALLAQLAAFESNPGTYNSVEIDELRRDLEEARIQVNVRISILLNLILQLQTLISI
jgi:hypothetical protein